MNWTRMKTATIAGGIFLFLATSELAARALDNNVDPSNLGQGDWIWKVPSCETALGVATPQAVIDYEAAKGMQWVTVKAADGVNEWSQWNSAIINEAHQKGLKIFAWVYVAGNDPGYSGGATTEAQELAVAKWALSVGGDGLIIDAESEYEGQAGAAAAYASGIKAAYPTRFLAYAPFPYISFHPTYPYVQFGTNCDAVMPQDYWADLGITVDEMVGDMDGEWVAWESRLSGPDTNAIKPIIPIGQGWNSTGYAEPASDITNFVYLLENDPFCASISGYHGVSYWECSQHPAAVWTGMATSLVLAGTNNLTVAQGFNATFAVNLPAGGSYRYQWQVNRANIAGATNSSWTVTNAQMANAGGYSALATNSRGCHLNYQATLSVISPPINSPASVLAPTNMVNWWPLDGNGNDLFGSLDGTSENGFYYTTGECGLAIHLDGATGFLEPNGSSLPPPWTVCLWVNRQNAPGTSAALMSDGNNTLKLEQVNFARQAGLSISGVADYTFGCTVPQNSWTHLAFVGTSTNTTLYVNGSITGTNNPMPVSIPLPRACIGVDFFVNDDAIGSEASLKFTDYMLGSLDEIQVFNRALSGAEIGSICSAGSAGLVRAPEFTGIASAGSGPIQLNLRGQTGKNFTLYASTNLVDWASQGIVSNPTGAVQYLDLTAPGTPQKFYRASQP